MVGRPGERVRYGLTKNIGTFHPVRVAFHEWVDIGCDVRRAVSWRDRAGYVFGHPGWAPRTTAAPTQEISPAPGS